MSKTLLDALQHSSPEEKLQALTALATEVFAAHGGTPVALTDAANRTVGYLSREVSAADIEPLSADDVAEIRRRMAAPGKLLTVDQFTAELEAGEGGTARR
jgi:hypothetical protein